MNTPTVSVPKVDRRHLQQIIAGLGEGILLLDPDGTFDWANETALAMHDATGLDELGGSADGYRKKYALRYRNNHPLTPEQYPADRIVAGDEFADVVVELSGRQNDDLYKVLRIRSLILSDKEGLPESLVLVMQDATHRFDAEERFEKTFNANPAPALICCLSNLRYVKVNAGFLAMTGYSREDVLEKSVYDLDVLQNAEEKERAIESLNEAATIPQMESTLRLPDGSRKFVMVAGQPIDMGDESCMLFTFIDLDARKKIESDLRHTSERLSKAFQLAPVPMIINSLDEFRFMEINDAFIETLGYSAQDVMTDNAANLPLWADPGAFLKLKDTLTQEGSLRNYEIQMRAKDGTLVDCLASSDTVNLQDQCCILSAIRDITERKRSEVELIAAIDAVMRDTSWFGQAVIEKLARIRHAAGTEKHTAELASLTSREREVLGLMCQGMDDDEIANHLHLSRNTVRNHVATLYSKLDVHRRGAAIVWARERGITKYEKSLPRTKPRS